MVHCVETENRQEMIRKRDKFWACSEKQVSIGGETLDKQLPATRNAWLSTVDSHVCQITSCEDDDDW